MKELINKINTVLNLIKDFATGYSSESCDQMMIDYKGKRYMVTFEELCNSNDEHMFVTMDRYWKR